MNRLTPAEYRYMRVIWEHPEGITSNELYKPYQLTMGAQSTILRKIVAKGFAVSEQRGKQVVYFPTGTRLEYDRDEISDEMEKKLGIGSIGALMAAFCGKDKLSEKEKKKLDQLIEELQENDDE